VTITKSITFDCDSGPGGILPGVTNAVVINAAGSTVTLRSLNLQGSGSGLDGVKVFAAGTVHLVDMNIYGFTQNGVEVAASAAVVLTVEDTRIHDNTGSGILTNSSGGLVTADYSRVSLWNNANGVNAQNASRVQIHNSTLVANGTGVNQTSLVTFGSVVTVFDSNFTGNGTAVQSLTGASIGVSGNVFSTNSLVFNLNGGTISSAGNDNFLFGNAGTGALSAPTPKI
jgi:hypothetical protein